MTPTKVLLVAAVAEIQMSENVLSRSVFLCKNEIRVQAQRL